MVDFDAINDLLLQWESARRDGRPIEPEELCPGCPDGQAELRRRIVLLQQFEAAFSLERTVPQLSDGLDGPPTVSGCTILGELGRGGMGVVYRAWQQDLGREVAVKVLKGRSNFPAEVVQRFTREARLLAKLSHDHIVPLYAAELHLGHPYFVMELVRGGSLADAIPRFVGAPPAAARLVEQVASAVQYAHVQGVLHRDLKPANILLDEQGQPHVSDFGLAKLLRTDPEKAAEGRPRPEEVPEGETLTVGGVMMGTPPYMAPEQFGEDATVISARTDVWALGVILYELLTNRRPFTGTHLRDYARSVCEDAPLPPRSLRPQLDRALEAVVLRCLQKDPARRYQTAAEVAEELARWRQGDTLRTYREPWPRRLWRRVRRRPALATAVLLLAVLLMAAASWKAVHGYLSDPERIRETIRREFAAGRSVTFIRDTGPPICYDWGEGAADAKASTEPDRPFFVSTHSVALVQLWDNPPPAFRLRADVQHDRGTGGGRVGLYLAHHWPNEIIPWPHCYVANFTDFDQPILNNRGPAARHSNSICMDFHYFQPRLDAAPIEGSYSIKNGLSFHPAENPDGRGDWRSIEVRVIPPAVEIYWKDNNHAMVLAARVEGEDFDRHAKFFAWLKPSMADCKFDPAWRGAIGLYVRNGAASFRNVVLEPTAFDPTK